VLDRGLGRPEDPDDRSERDEVQEHRDDREPRHQRQLVDSDRDEARHQHGEQGPVVVDEPVGNEAIAPDDRIDVAVVDVGRTEPWCVLEDERGDPDEDDEEDQLDDDQPRGGPDAAAPLQVRGDRQERQPDVVHRVEARGEPEVIEPKL
jgi:hypothetical protein